MNPAAPKYVMWAVVASVINSVGGVAFSLAWPDLDDRATVIGVSIVLGLLMTGAALWLWRGSRWGAIATLAINAFNVLLCVPAFFQDEAALLVGGAISLVLTVLTIGFVLHPQARDFWQHKQSPAIA